MASWCGRRDAAEEVAQRYLSLTCTGSIVHEPDGNVPPDFLVDGRVAVEVRRLNRNEAGSDRPVGLDRSATPFVHRFQTLLASARPSGHAAWWVGLEFKRPLPQWEVLAPPVRQLLGRFAADSSPRSERWTVASTVAVEILPRPTPARPFTLGWVTDADAGGCDIEEAARNMRLCIADKAAKVAKYRSRYPEWWLLLVDVAFGLDRGVGRRLYDTAIGLGWSRVIIIDPARPAASFELRPSIGLEVAPTRTSIVA
jgi:hypothetical protein